MLGDIRVLLAPVARHANNVPSVRHPKDRMSEPKDQQDDSRSEYYALPREEPIGPPVGRGSSSAGASGPPATAHQGSLRSGPQGAIRGVILNAQMPGMGGPYLSLDIREPSGRTWTVRKSFQYRSGQIPAFAAGQKISVQGKVTRAGYVSPRMMKNETTGVTWRGGWTRGPLVPLLVFAIIAGAAILGPNLMKLFSDRGGVEVGVQPGEAWNVRSGPSVDSSVLGQVAGGESVRVTCISGSWAKLSSPYSGAYVSTQPLLFSSRPPTC